MTDFDRLRRLPELAPLPGQADAALAVVRERRRRGLVRTGAVAATAALVATVMSTVGPSTSVLDQVDKGVEKTATAVPSPTGHGGETESVTGPRSATPTTGATSTRGPAYTGTGGTSGASPAGGARPPRSDAPPRPRPEVRRKIQNAVEARLDEEGPTPGCTPTPGGTGKCGSVTYERDGDEQVTVRLTICTGTGLEIDFPGEQEIDLVVRTEPGAEVWRWGRGVRFAAEPHTITLDAEECVSWFLTWDYGDEAGDRVAPGRYRVEVPVLSKPDEMYGFTLDVA
ncbi:MAG TPA: BsuPI-related putative proteinase inhibitor [Frankiaceae bacterium]|nr:BsuPI-related putative proteinase inhibitor [Frankiaceae bacterium]